MRPRHHAGVAVAALFASALTLPAAQAREIAPTPGKGRWVTVSGHLVAAGEESVQYAVLTAEGQLVPVIGRLAGAVNDRVEVRVRVPSALDALEGPWHSSQALDDWGRPLAAELTERADVVVDPTPTKHTVYVARPTNLGDFSMSDAAVLAALEPVADYWMDESEGQIAQFDLPDGSDDQAQFATFETIASAENVCSLWSFATLFTEAAAKFPGVQFLSPDTSNHLVIVTPDGGCTSSTLGIATSGQGLANGGAVAARSVPWALEKSMAHELGHNFGLGHSNLGTREYANVYNNVMGAFFGAEKPYTALSTTYRVQLGLVADGEIEPFVVSDHSQATSVTVTLEPRSELTGLRSLAVTPPDTRRTVYVDYRSGGGQDDGSFYDAGFEYEGYEFRPGVVVEEPVEPQEFGVSLVTDRHTDRVATVAGETWTSPSGTVTISVTGMDESGAQVTAAYTPPPPFTPGGVVTMSGVPRVGTTVQADLSGFEPAPEDSDVQWLLDGDALPSETGWTFVPRAEHVGHELSVRATQFASGRLPTTVTSGVVAVEPGVLTFSDGPALSSSSPVVGQPLSVGYDSLGALADSSFQWYADGSPVAGATTQTFVPTSVQTGRRLTASVSLGLPGWTTVTAFTPPSAPVQPASVAPPPPPTLDPTPATLTGPKPTIKGKAVVGKRLTAKTGAWPAGTRFTYRWLANGKVVRKATSATLRVKPPLEGTRLSVRVTAAKPGYGRVTLVSARTKRVSGRARAGGLPALEPGIQVPGRGGRELLGSGSPLP